MQTRLTLADGTVLDLEHVRPLSEAEEQQIRNMTRDEVEAACRFGAMLEDAVQAYAGRIDAAADEALR